MWLIVGFVELQLVRGSLFAGNPEFQTPEPGSSEAFWILVDFVWNVNRVIPECNLLSKSSGFDAIEDL